MKRWIAVLLIAIATLVVLPGCDNAEVDTPEAGGSDGTSAAADTETSTPATGSESMATDGPGEAAALAALPAALPVAQEMREGAGLDWPDLTGTEPAFTAYIIIAEMNGQGSLFEVRADGIVHGIYAYQKAFDAATMIWSPSEYSTSPRTAPQSAAEQAAVSAVASAMSDSFPDSAISVSVYGYRFVYSKDGTAVMTIEIATDGSVISAG